MTTLAKVSIIVPIYNVEKFLVRCIESICQQTYRNLQIILVDDGSTDSCSELCDTYKAKDSRIEVIHKENGGLSSARNAGITRAEGEFIYFVDSDDYIEPNLVERCLQEITYHNADVIVFNYILETESLEQLNMTSFAEDVITFRNKKDIIDYLSLKQINYNISGWNAWNRFFRRSLFQKHDLLFPDNRVVFAEDLAFSLRASLCLNKIVVIKDCLYHYVQQNDSIMHKTKIIPYEKIMNLCLDFEQFVDANGYSKDFENVKAHVFLTILLRELRKQSAHDIDGMLDTISTFPSEKQSYIKQWCKKCMLSPFKAIKIYRGLRIPFISRVIYLRLNRKDGRFSLSYQILMLMKKIKEHK